MITLNNIVSNYAILKKLEKSHNVIPEKNQRIVLHYCEEKYNTELIIKT